jgi:RNA polymerase sigma-70 factor (ECF subfamily)
MATTTTLGNEGLTTALERARAGDEAAFTLLVQAHHADLARVAYVICGDADLGEEAAQAAWAIAWRKLANLREPERLRPWLVAIAANEARQLVRRKRRRSLVEIPVDGDGPGSHGADPAGRAAGLDLVNSLARLSPDDRSLLALRYVAGLTSFELARALGGSASGTRARLARLLERLRKDLADE